MDLTLLNALAYLEKPDGLIALPGPEDYVLAVRPDHPAALARLYRLKGNTEPLLLLGFDFEALSPFIAPLPPSAQDLIHRYWPGPLILLVEKAKHLTDSFNTIGQVKILQPEHPYLLDFLALNPGGVLATVCATRLSQPDKASARSAAAVLDTFGDDIDFVIPGDETILESVAPTVVWVKSNQQIQLLRSGAIVLD